MNIQLSEVDIKYILHAISDTDIDRECSFFSLEKIDKNLQTINSISSLIKFDTVKEAIEFFKVLSKDMNHAESIIYTDIYDFNCNELIPFRNSTGTYCAMVQVAASYTHRHGNEVGHIVIGYTSSQTWPSMPVRF